MASARMRLVQGTAVPRRVQGKPAGGTLGELSALRYTLVYTERARGSKKARERERKKATTSIFARPTTWCRCRQRAHRRDVGR